jgi:hypothetical protein
MTEEEEKVETIVDPDIERRIPNDLSVEDTLRMAERLSKEKALDIRKHGTCQYAYDTTSKERSHNKGGRKKTIGAKRKCGKRCIGYFCHNHKVTRLPKIIINEKMVTKSRESESKKGKRMSSSEFRELQYIAFKRMEARILKLENEVKEIPAMKKEICDLKIMLGRKMDKKK